ncbi:conserved hypothetical protein [Burkholderia ambifaria MEX-5]|uniref:Uncharacterized protein n=1 Tax=Burkholderia ambifaria MEX-5 TaxID=396597 RepID=B1TFD0_9BURK|nr:conserved hypothetical protein [Burkholderia ambifaria MEX-5]
MLDRAQVEPADEAVLAGHLVAFDEFGNPPQHLLDQMQLPRQRLHADDRLQRVAERARVELDGEARDHALRFEPPHAVGGRGRRQPDLPRQFAGGDARILGKRREDRAVGRVQ